MAKVNRMNLIILLTVVSFCFCTSTVNALVNNKIDRIIDLSSQLVKITERIHLDDANPNQYTYKMEKSHRDRLAYMEVTLDKKPIEFTETESGNYLFKLEGLTVKQPLVVVSVFTKLLEPYPAEITQSERQLVRYQGLQATLSPYLTKTITTKIVLPNGSRLESFTKASKMTTGSNRLTYGPFKDIQPNGAEALMVHLENNTPFIAITRLERTIDISPWSGSINIVNEVKVAHVGAKLKGPFSRIDYQRDQTSGISSVRLLLAELPRSAYNIYFRDAIGNISTSNVRLSSTKTYVGVKPRFPLFGGWVTDFILGYKVPIKTFLNEPASGMNYRLSVPFADVMYENMFIEDATVRIILPAIAPSSRSSIDVKSPVGFVREKDELRYSYLDVIGRPVIVLRRSNTVSQHLDNKPLVIRYDYTQAYMFQEPLLLMAVAIISLILYTIYSKLSATSHIHTHSAAVAAQHKSKSD